MDLYVRSAVYSLRQHRLQRVLERLRTSAMLERRGAKADDSTALYGVSRGAPLTMTSGAGLVF